MIGFSIKLSDDIEMVEEYINMMEDASFKYIFTTIYEPDEDKSDYLEKIKKIGDMAKKKGMKLTLGTSESSIKQVGLNVNPKAIKELGIDGIRVTSSTDLALIAELSKEIMVGISASHTSEEDLDKLYELGANPKNLQVWYSYYDREEIGLSKAFMKKRNKFWRFKGIKTVAFAPGDKKYYDDDVCPRLTLEKHRDRHPLFATIDLLEDMKVDTVYIGDSPLNKKTINQFYRYMKEEIIVYYADVVDYEYFPLLVGVHRNRVDEAELVIRSEKPVNGETRIVDRYLVSRRRGALTIDNQRNGRFMGEFNITKEDLNLSRKVNVVAHIREEDLDLIDKCHGGVYFEIAENI